ncbi:sn-glycerol-3-phosphate ABC transporter ATP-binding protein UgpC [Peribacillus cavernae]|uniref:sn-glycerol-3-phosphate ABC transporter ATP-binding protein UgpC n=2 Tax=Peribacillus cavernae TaxID=1674310 RepID=A0A3S0VY26_9BACI|nr:sn-glycerol-3-phosphate ABC transporter ATP-binding protein UgpC [Peribacillus cavernae]RUQ28689.1 sn-glycerol-3-phosphate ABC transporter ATP-binding protein UgpC [Peribacillus cavernae]
MNALSLHNIDKYYENGAHAVKGLNLDINRGEFIVVVGPSGCGKSTTLRMIAGFEKVTNGEIKVNDKFVNDLEPMKRGMSMVFQSYALYPYMTVYENIAFPLKMRNMRKDEIKRKVEEAAEVVNVTPYLKRKPGQLSGGQRQRVALARAMVANTAICLMDEPLSNLDAALRTGMRREIKKLHQRLQNTIVYVTHDQVEAMTLGTRIVVMKDGMIQQIDTPQNIYEKPANSFVASFIGNPQMNICTASVIKEGKQVKLLFGGEDLTLPPQTADMLERQNYVNKDILIGFRATDVLYEEGFVAEVEHVELLGNEQHVKANWNGQQVSLQAPSSMPIDKAVSFSINLDKLHFFDSDTEERIC